MSTCRMAGEMDIGGVRINPEARIISKEGEYGALIVTGQDKVKSGYGNGDCLLLNLRDALFALSDGTERYARASRDLLERVCEEVDRGVPREAQAWLALVNRVFAAQKYQHKATFSLAALHRQATGTSLCIIHGGDSLVAVVNMSTGRVEYRTEPDMNFAGRSRGLSEVRVLPLSGDAYRLVLASDGLADVARWYGWDVPGMLRTFFVRESVHQIPEILRAMIRSADAEGGAGNYDDIGVLVVDPLRLKLDAEAQIVMGGTDPREENAYQKRIREAGTREEWFSLQELPDRVDHVARCGIRIRGKASATYGWEEQQAMNAKKQGKYLEDRKSNDISEMRRAQLIRAAYKVVSRKGYYNFTIKDIAKESGLSSGLVHYYFKNKQDLLLNLLKDLNRNMKSYLNKELVMAQDPLHKLITYMDQAFSLAVREKEYFFVVIDFWTQTQRNPRMRQANNRLLQSYRDECAAILKEGIAAGVFNEVDVKFTATTIVAVIQGAIIQYVLDNEAFDYEQYSTKIKDYITSILIKTK